MAGSRDDRDLADTAANDLNASGAGMANTLNQNRRRMVRPLLLQVPNDHKPEPTRCCRSILSIG
jgi:hypothetical protein